MICSSIEEWKHPRVFSTCVIWSKSANESKFSMLEIIIPNNKIWRLCMQLCFKHFAAFSWRVIPQTHIFPPGAVVSAVEATGLIATWNQQHPQEAIGVWDRLLAVNGITKLNENLADEFLGSLIFRVWRGLVVLDVPGCSSKFGNDWWCLMSQWSVVVQKNDVIWYLGCASGVQVGVFGIVLHLDLLLRCAFLNPTYLCNIAVEHSLSMLDCSKVSVWQLLFHLFYFVVCITTYWMTRWSCIYIYTVYLNVCI